MSTHESYNLSAIKSAKHGSKILGINLKMFADAVKEWNEVNLENNPQYAELGIEDITKRTRGNLNKYIELIKEFQNMIALSAENKLPTGKLKEFVGQKDSQLAELGGEICFDISMQANTISASIADQQWDPHQRIKHHITNGIKALSGTIDATLKYTQASIVR